MGEFVFFGSLYPSMQHFNAVFFTHLGLWLDRNIPALAADGLVGLDTKSADCLVCLFTFPRTRQTQGAICGLLLLCLS